MRVEHLLAKEGKLAAMPGSCFTTPHFDGYPAVLVRLGAIRVADLEDLLVEAWLSRAPGKLAREYVETKKSKGRRRLRRARTPV